MPVASIPLAPGRCCAYKQGMICALFLAAAPVATAPLDLPATTSGTPPHASTGTEAGGRPSRDGAFTRAKAALSAIAEVPAAERTVANTLVAMDDVVAALFEDVRFAGFMADVSTDPLERESGRALQNELSNWFDSFGKNAEMFRALQELEALSLDMTPEQSQFFRDTVRDFRRAGLDLPEASRDRLVAIDEEITDLGSDFRENIADDETFMLFTEEELEGLPESFLTGLPRSGGLVYVTMKGPNLGYVLTYCDSEATRAKMGVAAGRRGGERNVRILEKLLKLRHERAMILGYPSAAAYVTENRMAGSPATVLGFYDDLRPKLRKKALQDFEEFEAAKREHTGDPEARLLSSDMAYYTNWLKRERYAVDTRTLRHYFSMDTVTGGLFDVYQELFGVTFHEITADARAEGRPLWHDDVRLFRVDDSRSGALLGEFYLDLHPRDGKFSHAAQFPLRLRKVWSDGRVSTPLVALVCNFTKPTKDEPSLLSHGEVETYFHEFGHCLHSILTEATLASLAGTNVARDFVEAPSQMLENWVWQPEVLGRFARHYETGAALPEEIIEGMIAAKNLGAGISNEGQVFLGLMDMRFHTDPDGVVDTTAVSEETYRDARLFEPAEHLVRQAAFGHLVGYEAGYYGYLWSSVYAQDMWSRFADNPMNPEVAMEYRRLVLGPGGSRPALDLVRAFLGREPNSAAFLEHLGLE